MGRRKSSEDKVGKGMVKRRGDGESEKETQSL